ncbi:hypothetical protein [Lacihabitans sp. LS3-19]|uniref:hypothetical protein n=1 Tax=Lacihabitans sp. LS3-19 TaxID=2487335 RepID=UPI0020CDCDD3|nr:hypothetical protein [Lacihabitans sp. LS3-19]
MNFEFWPWKVFYAPLIPYYLYLSIKNRNIFFPANVNIGLKNGGFFEEDKKEILKNIPSQFLPNSLYVSESETTEGLILEIYKNNIAFPLIAKPLNEQRGKNVEIIKDENELDFYHKKLAKEYIVQEFISHPIELAILVSRMPGDNHWEVSSITKKEFLSVKGDGKRDVKGLLKTNPRAVMIWEDLLRNVKVNWDEVLPENEVRIIEKIGNHCRGTIFRNAIEIDKEKVAVVVSEILKNFEGFNYGRFDLKVKSIEDLYAGENIRILELNGVNADSAHVFDPDYKLFNAYKDIAWHWKRLSDIALLNAKQEFKFKAVYANLKNNLLT